jgi:subtilisin family serine protease/subtilisin-like proprotein convertase family protein
MSYRQLVPFLLMALFAGLVGSLVADAQAEVTPSLQRALETSDFPWSAKDGTLTVWVYFQDKGLEGAQLQRALDQAESELSDKVAWRRGKMKPAGARLVDEGDLDLHAPYLRAVEATGAVLRRESRWLNAASFQASAEQIQQMAQLSMVDRVDLVAKFRRPVVPAEDMEAPDPADKSETSRWAIDYGANQAAMEQFNVPQVHEMGFTGQGVVIGMLDSGFRTTHEALSSIPVLAAYDFVNDDNNVDNEGDDPSNANDHGTKTMSTAMGNMPGELVAPAFGASAILAKTEDVADEVPIEEDQWVAGLEWVEAQGADIVSSSLGYSDWYTWADMDGATAVTTLAGDLAVLRGLVVINSAGNERDNSWGHIIAPADGFNIISVGAVTSSGTYTSFSSPGPSYDGRIKPDVAALGQQNAVVSSTSNTDYTTASGTSFSCPLTSGVAALILSRAPNLTPFQVRDALRETASQAQSPDNDYGWGLIDALAAVTYFGPNFTHTPLGDTEDTTGPYTLGMTITDREGLDESTALLRYRTDGGPWLDVPIWPTGGGPVSYYAAIPGQAAGSTVDYYLTASSTTGIVTTLPGQAPDQFFSFQVGPDVTLPVLTHTPLRDQVPAQWPPVVTAMAEDNLGIASVELFYSLNGGAEVGPFALGLAAPGEYALGFPLAVEAIAVGDQFSYRLVAQDAAGTPNVAQSGPHTFDVVDAKGVVLVLEDADPGTVDEKIDLSRKDRPLLAPMSGKSSAGTVATWLTEDSYLVDVLPAAGVTPSQLQGYDVVVLAAGNNANPVADATLRSTLQGWAGSGGKLLIEGGEIGYDAESSPGYPDFADQVLHVVDWDSDNAGRLLRAPGQESHPILTAPNLIPVQIELTYDGYGDQDGMEPAPEAYAVMVPSSFQNDVGILVYDDNPAPQSAQIVYLAFNVEAIDPATGRALIENALAYLVAHEAPPTSSLAGRVTLAGENDHSGVLVDLGNGQSILTGSDGTWAFADLYSGTYPVTASLEGWATDRQTVSLADGEHLAGVNLVLSPILETNYVLYPDVPIPDNDPSGVTSTLVVPASEAGIISAVTVDTYIQHSWIGDLTVLLVSPAGTSVVLHNRTGSSDDNILGNWPESLTVDGPGSLEDFIGENNAGIWTLFVYDTVGSDAGTLSMWGLNFLLPSPVVAAPDGGLPSATRLHGNVPNPFNPMTDIRFDLARNSRVSLEIFDLRGRLVARLVDESLSAGSHAVTWDGRDAKGNAVSSGTYLYRLRAGDLVQDRKMLLVR